MVIWSYGPVIEVDRMGILVSPDQDVSVSYRDRNSVCYSTGHSGVGQNQVFCLSQNRGRCNYIEAERNSRFNGDDLFAVLQAVAGFASAVATKDPFAFLASATGLAQHFVATKDCLGPLDDMLDSLDKWLTFGANYTPLNDSSELDFDLLNVDSVPELMEVSLDFGVSL